MNKLFLTILGVFLISGLVFAADTNNSQYVTVDTANYNVNIESPLAMDLISDYTISPSTIIIRTGDSVNLVGGQSLISKYNFTNRLDYSVVGRYELKLGITDDAQLDKIRVFIAEALPEIDCVSKGGEILMYNGNRIKIINTETPEKELYLCYILKASDYSFDTGNLILDMVMQPGANEKYILFVTSPTLTLANTQLTFEDTIKLKEMTDKEAAAVITTANKDNSDDLKQLDVYNNQETYEKINPNYNTRDVITGEQTTNGTATPVGEQLSAKAGILKSEATALITMTPTKGIIIGIGVLAIIGLALVIYSRKSKDLSDVN